MRGLRAVAAVILLAVQPPAHAQSGEAGPALLEADRVFDDREAGTTVAEGNVRVVQAGRILLADRVVYDRGAGKVTAAGNVSLHEPSGEVLFADRVTLDETLANAVIENAGARLADGARMAAAGGRRTDGSVTRFRKAVYSPCRTCGDDPDGEPLWQVKAYRATHDQEARDIVYEDAFLEFLGLPVLYVPWLSRPDPSVERRSGLLTPSYGSDDTLGAILKAPVYVDFAPEMDLTLTPVLTTREGFGTELQFRHLLADAEYEIAGSLYHDPERDSPDVDELRGFTRSWARLHLDRHWRASADVHLASDDTFLHKYEFVSRDTLENRARLEGFLGTDYAAATAIYFQDLSPAHASGDVPLVAPMLEYSLVGNPGPAGQLWKIDADLLALYRRDGTDTRRASARTWWELPHVGARGELYRLFGSLQTDAYWTNDSATGKARQRLRLFPQAGIDLRLPLSRSEGGLVQTLEPAASFVLAPDTPSTRGIPNEDSVGVEFNDVSLFSPNRHTGVDRVEGNPRFNYGLHGAVHGAGGGSSSFFLGQSYRFGDGNEFAPGTGLHGRVSDVVGRVRVSPGEWMDAFYRFRLDSSDWSARFNRIRLSAGVPELRLDAAYLLAKSQDIRGAVDPDDLLQEREEIRAGLSSRFARHWRGGVRMHRDLTDGGRSLRHGAYVAYEDECFEFRIDYSRRFTGTSLRRPQDTIFVRVALKTLGQFEVSESTGGDDR